jgi:hypothetical protein
MAQTIVISREDGGVSIMRLSASGWTDRETPPADDEIESEVRRATLPSPAVSWRLVAETDVPARDEYRGAWRDDGAAIVHDLERARAIYRERVPARRAGMLSALDVEYQRADEAEDRAAKRAVAANKQRLRDATSDPRIEQASTIEALRALDVLA